MVLLVIYYLIYATQKVEFGSVAPKQFLWTHEVTWDSLYATNENHFKIMQK